VGEVCLWSKTGLDVLLSYAEKHSSEKRGVFSPAAMLDYCYTVLAILSRDHPVYP